MSQHKEKIMNLYTVFMPSLARQLQAQGFQIVKIEPNKKKPEFSVYLFENTPEFQAALFKLLQ